MGLSFLNKKKVHPGSFGNIEEVWKRESQFKERERKMIENEKKLKEERQSEEITRLKVDAGLLPASYLERLDFIYKEGPEINNKKVVTSDEFFSSKKISERKIPTPIANESSANPLNEMFTKIHEDPLYIMKKEEMKRKKEIENNPYQMRLILKEIEDELVCEEKKVKKELKNRSESKEERRLRKEKRRAEKELLKSLSHKSGNKVDLNSNINYGLSVGSREDRLTNSSNRSCNLGPDLSKHSDNLRLKEEYDKLIKGRR